jgi:hypothetical protein
MHRKWPSRHSGASVSGSRALSVRGLCCLCDAPPDRSIARGGTAQSSYSVVENSIRWAGGQRQDVILRELRSMSHCAGKTADRCIPARALGRDHAIIATPAAAGHRTSDATSMSRQPRGVPERGRGLVPRRLRPEADYGDHVRRTLVGSSTNGPLIDIDLEMGQCVVRPTEGQGVGDYSHEGIPVRGFEPRSRG